MSKAFKCDLCGKLYEGKIIYGIKPPILKTGHILLCEKNNDGNYVGGSSKEFDACPECFEKISEMIHSKEESDD